VLLNAAWPRLIIALQIVGLDPDFVEVRPLVTAVLAPA
jgi:hypothetical protein